MKTFKDSELNFKCKECGVGIYNATESYKSCPECGGELKVMITVKERVYES